MYTKTNYKTKKALKAAVTKGDDVGYFQPNSLGGDPIQNGQVFIEGPHGCHKWYAQCVVSKGKIVKVL